MRTALAIAIALAAACDRRVEPRPAVEQVPAPIAPAPVPVPAAASTGEVLTFTPAPITPGASWVATFDADLDFDLNFGGHGQITTTHQSKVKKVTALATEHGVVTRARITYSKRKTSMMIDGDPQTDRSVIRGKTYLVAWNGAGVEVETADGRTPTAEEIEQVTKEEDPGQTFEALVRALTTVRLVKGEPTEVPETAFVGFGDRGLVPERVVVTWIGRDGDLAVLEVDAVLASRDAGLKLFVDLAGTLQLDRTGWCRSADVTVQIRAELNNAEVGGGVGKGTITMSPRR